MAKDDSADPLFFELNNGLRIPSVGLGTWQADPGVVGDAIVAAVKAGYRHIDCARMYGNEKEIGMALKKLFTEGVVKREDMWITSKLWCTDHAPEDVPVAMERTLQDLQLDYVDLYLVHWPFRMEKGITAASKVQKFCPVAICSTWRAMEKLYDSGKAHAIGVSNFSTKKLGDLLMYARITPAVNQAECHLLWQQMHLRAFCESKGIHLSAHTPLGSRGRSSVETDILKNPIINMVAEKLCKTPARVSLRWGLQNGMSVLPKSANESRIKENIDLFGWSIPHDLFLKFSEIEQRRLVAAPGHFAVHETVSLLKSLEELWDGE